MAIRFASEIIKEIKEREPIIASATSAMVINLKNGYMENMT